HDVTAMFVDPTPTAPVERDGRTVPVDVAQADVDRDVNDEQPPATAVAVDDDQADSDTTAGNVETHEPVAPVATWTPDKPVTPSRWQQWTIKRALRAGLTANTRAAIAASRSDQAARAAATQRRILGALSVGVALGVGISSTTAQTTIVDTLGWQQGSIPAALAYLADPALASVAFAVLALIMRAAVAGVAIPAKSKAAFYAIEVLTTSMIVLLNVGPSVGVPHAAMTVIVHLIGPAVAASGIIAIPHAASVLGVLNSQNTRSAEQSQNTAEDPRVIAAAALVRAGLAEGTGPERLTIRGVGGWLRERGHSIDNSRVRDVITAVQAES
ncbi:hypothetical protein, partial [Saccharopolyspora shandongensis]|uniref:hypothetical protein n=1 Tax=Saccharopolyspora shandongensis TaxID=418495 RepID=UPI0033D7D851